MYHFFAMLSRMKLINRWGLMRNTRAENLCEHSYETAIVAHALVLIHNKHSAHTLNADRAATLALYHDVTEIITGDMPTPIKYYSSEIRKAYNEVEDMAQSKLVSMLPKEYADDYGALISFCDEDDKALYKYVKAADKLSALIKCIEEGRMGNTEFKKAEQTILNSIEQLDLPEADYFIKEFLPSYSLTLDEQD